MHALKKESSVLGVAICWPHGRLRENRGRRTPNQSARQIRPDGLRSYAAHETAKETKSAGEAGDDCNAKSESAKPSHASQVAAGQPNALSKLDDALEKKICGFIASGMVWEDACQLCGIHRKTAWDWKCRGDAGEPRYVQFLENTLLAELRAKALLIGKIRNNPDWKAQKFLLCNRYPKEFRDHVVKEVTGPSGGPIPVAVNPFHVHFELAGDPEVKFSTIDHRTA